MPGSSAVRGRGGRAAHSSSPEEEDCSCNKYFEFVVFISDDHFGKKKLPDAFVEFLDCRGLASVTLREACCNFRRWMVEVLFNGEGKIYLHTAWKKFAHNHNIEVGCLVNFFYEGDDKMNVKAALPPRLIGR
jgi:hypothetical protein